eukprot:853757-Prymnesium_polylepis.2
MLTSTSTHAQTRVAARANLLMVNASICTPSLRHGRWPVGVGNDAPRQPSISGRSGRRCPRCAPGAPSSSRGDRKAYPPLPETGLRGSYGFATFVCRQAHTTSERAISPLP